MSCKCLCFILMHLPILNSIIGQYISIGNIHSYRIFSAIHILTLPETEKTSLEAENPLTKKPFYDRKKALEIKDFSSPNIDSFKTGYLSYRPSPIFFSCCCISRLTPATGLISGFYQFLPGALIAFFVAFFNRAYTGAIRIMEFF